MAIDRSAAGFTVRVAVALTEPDEIPIVVEPGVNVVTCPAVAASLLIVATPPAVEVQ